MAIDKPPKGGWLGPPGNTANLPPEAIATRARKGKWVWKELDHTPKQEKKRTKFFRAMKEADAEGETSFEWE